MADTLKDKDRQQYYDTMDGLFGHPGWVLLMEDAHRLAAQTNSLDSVDETHSVEFRKGELHNLKWLIAQESVHRACFDAELAEQGAPE